ncbi:MAG TPA: hypothetical protein VF183_01475, partial [Acidimicrobiales bacterium]
MIDPVNDPRVRRVAYVAADQPHTEAIERAFRELTGGDAAHNVLVYPFERRARDHDVDREFAEWIGTFQPDWVWMQLEDTGVIRPQTIARARQAAPRAVFTDFTLDYAPKVTAYRADIAAAVDIAFVPSRGQLAAYFEAGCHDVSYCPPAVDWRRDVFGTHSVGYEVPDVVFVGNCYADSPWPKGTQERLDTVRAIRDAGFDVGVFGAGWPSDIRVVRDSLPFVAQSAVYREARIVLSVSHANDVEGYFSDRLPIAMASGTPVLAMYSPGLEELFDEGD